MARRRFKLTGFSRFLIFMLFFVPIAYIGISYYQGEDGLQKAKEVVTNLSQKKVFDNNETKEVKPQEGKIDLDDQIQILRTRIEQLEKENAELKKALEEARR